MKIRDGPAAVIGDTGFTAYAGHCPAESGMGRRSFVDKPKVRRPAEILIFI